MRISRVATLLLMLTLGVGGACSKRTLGQGEGRVMAQGAVQVARAGARPWQGIDQRVTVRSGDRVRVLEGSASVELSEGRRVELRKGSQVEVGERLLLQAGELLAVAGERPITVSSAGSDSRVARGAARVQRRLALITASYTALVDMNSAGRRLRVPALRQAVITAPGLIPERPTPLDYDPADPWDRRFLGEAIELGDELASRSRDFTAQLAPGEGRTVGFYRQLIPALDGERDFEPPLLDDARAPGETLVGTAIAVESRKGSFRERWAEIFSFRDQGAAWGLVVLDQRVTRSPLLSTIDSAIGRRGSSSAVAATPAPPPPAPPAAEPAPVPGAGPRRPTAPPAAAPGVPPPATPPPGRSIVVLPAPPATPPLAPPPTGGLAETVSGLVDTIDGILDPRS